MEFLNLKKEKVRQYFNNIESCVLNKQEICIKYLDFGFKKVRLIVYDFEFLAHIEKQLAFCVKDTPLEFNSTLFLWKEKNINALANLISDDFNSKLNLRLRVESLYKKNRMLDFIRVYSDDFSKTKPQININFQTGIFSAFDVEKNNYYYGVKNLDFEEFIKEGHLFVQFFNEILKTRNSNLIHGAVIGLNNTGVLICARGQMGKSTLAVSSLLKGFEYVSDDYLILLNKNGNLVSSLIYSIITLSPFIYEKLKKLADGFEFVSKNARKDKFVFNISKYHDNFRVNYPIKLCIFPNLTFDNDPKILPCTPEEKGRAIVQLLHSTLTQMQDLEDLNTIKKILNMVKDFPFYKFNLSCDIDKNTDVFSDFLNKFDLNSVSKIGLEKICVDVTSDISYILNTDSCQFYTMNKFATNIYQNLLNGVSESEILSELLAIPNMPETIKDSFNSFVTVLKDKKIFKKVKPAFKKPDLNIKFIKEDDYKLSLVEFSKRKNNQLIRENIT